MTADAHRIGGKRSLAASPASQAAARARERARFETNASREEVRKRSDTKAPQARERALKERKASRAKARQRIETYASRARGRSPKDSNASRAKVRKRSEANACRPRKRVIRERVTLSGRMCDSVSKLTRSGPGAGAQRERERERETLPGKRCESAAKLTPPGPGLVLAPRRMPIMPGVDYGNQEIPRGRGAVFARQRAVRRRENALFS